MIGIRKQIVTIYEGEYFLLTWDTEFSYNTHRVARDEAIDRVRYGYAEYVPKGFLFDHELNAVKTMLEYYAGWRG